MIVLLCLTHIERIVSCCAVPHSVPLSHVMVQTPRMWPLLSGVRKDTVCVEGRKPLRGNVREGSEIHRNDNTGQNESRGLNVKTGNSAGVGTRGQKVNSIDNGDDS